MAGLDDLTGRLAAAIGQLTDETHLTISRPGSENYVDDEGRNRFVQFAHFGGNIRAESVGPMYLTAGDGLSTDDLAVLRGLGWQDPDEGGNYWRHWEVPVDFHDVASVTLATLERVHGAIHPGQLGFDGPPEVLDAVGARFETDPDHRSGPTWVEYSDYDPDATVSCPLCGWTGRAGDHEEPHTDLLDVSCPDCGEMILIAVYPTPEETSRGAVAPVSPFGSESSA
ncbi:MAG: hypothetical protein RIE08_08925 [Acidimicrobiales bacterium]